MEVVSRKVRSARRWARQLKKALPRIVPRCVKDELAFVALLFIMMENYEINLTQKIKVPFKIII